jgi:hypothetical protein
MVFLAESDKGRSVVVEPDPKVVMNYFELLRWLYRPPHRQLLLWLAGQHAWRWKSEEPTDLFHIFISGPLRRLPDAWDPERPFWPFLWSCFKYFCMKPPARARSDAYLRALRLWWIAENGGFLMEVFDPDPCSDPAVLAERKEETQRFRHALTAALNKLSLPMALAFIYHRVHGLDRPVTATCLGITDNYVGVLVYNATLRIAEHLRRNGFDA